MTVQQFAQIVKNWLIVLTIWTIVLTGCTIYFFVNHGQQQEQKLHKQICIEELIEIPVEEIQEY